MKYYNNKKIILSIFWIILGILLIVLEKSGTVNSDYIIGLSGGFIAVGCLQLYRNIKYRTDSEFKENIDIQLSDERSRYIRMKAWSIAGYICVLGCAAASLVCLILKMKTPGMILSFVVCFNIIVYYITLLVLNKKD